MLFMQKIWHAENMRMILLAFLMEEEPSIRVMCLVAGEDVNLNKIQNISVIFELKKNFLIKLHNGCNTLRLTYLRDFSIINKSI